MSGDFATFGYGFCHISREPALATTVDASIDAGITKLEHNGANARMERNMMAYVEYKWTDY
ncbi:hypothetical protein C9I56_34750 [Paraburkholderia caribensis]|nr:hypothetical protein C9I56_34750 [Paraburkholderia caribensis]